MGRGCFAVCFVSNVGFPCQVLQIGWLISWSECTCNLRRGHSIEAATAGVTVTLIDFTLSRLTALTGDVAFCDLAADPELFQGPKGDVQVHATCACGCLETTNE